VRLPSDAVKRDTLTSLAAGGGCTAASCEAVGLANKLTTPNEVLAIQVPAMVPMPEAASAPAASASATAAPAASASATAAPAAVASAAPLATAPLAGDGLAAELVALQAQLAALKAVAGQQ
jgi:hypothetical protein